MGRTDPDQLRAAQWHLVDRQRIRSPAPRTQAPPARRDPSGTHPPRLGRTAEGASQEVPAWPGRAHIHRSRGGIFNDRGYLKVFHQARASAFIGQEAASLLARRPYDLRHAAVSTWLNAGVAAPQVADWAGHSVDVLLRVYAKCISGQQYEAKRRIEEATRPRDDE